MNLVDSVSYRARGLRAKRVALAIVAAASVFGADAAAVQDQALSSALAEAFDTAGATTPFSGVFVVGDESGRIYQRVHGFANYEHQIPIEQDHRFRIASVSKQFAGVLAALLADEGTVDLDQAVEAYLPVLNGSPAGAATVRDLLRHRSGLSAEDGYMWAHVISEYAWDWQANRSVSTFAPDTFQARMRSATQASPPGETYQYCNECYRLAAEVLAAAAGSPYEALLSERILRPLGMSDTGLDSLDLYLERRVYPYEWVDGSPRPITRWRNLAPLGPAGAMYSTVGDLERWVRAVFYSDDFLPPAVRADLFPDSSGYENGFQRTRFESSEGEPVDVIHHTGQIAGTFAWIAYLPDFRRHVIVLSNLGFTFPQNRFMADVIAALGVP